MKLSFCISLICSVLLLQTFNLNATHNRSGEILYYKVPGAYTYSIVVIKYTNDGSGIADRCADTVHFGDGSTGILQRINGTAGACCGSTPCGQLIVNQTNYKVKKNIYSIVHTYPGPGNYLIRSLDPNRSAGSVNIPNSVNLPFYIESLLIIDLKDSDNSSPQLPRAPIDQGVVGDCFYHNPCAFDPDGDSLSFEITTCRGTNGQTAPGYFYPSGGAGGIFVLDSETGLLTWCKPQAQGMYNVAMIIKEWRKPDCISPYVLKGYVMRDMEIMISTGASSIITTSTLADTCLPAGNILNRSFIANIGSPTTFTLEVLGSASSPFTGAYPALITPSAVSSGSSALLSWTTTCAHSQRLPHYVHVVVTANTMPFPRTVYRTFKVTLTPPSPKMVSVSTSTNQITLTWNSLKSCTGLKGYNIYRNLTNSNWTPLPCSNGIPGNSGYNLIGSVNTGTPIDTVFTDTDLWWLPVTASGNYIVTALMNDCSESIADTIISKKLLVGLLDRVGSKDELTVYPNPSQSQFIVSIPSLRKEFVHVMVFSVDGKKVMEQSGNAEKQLAIDSSNFPDGVYLLRLLVGDKAYQQKIIKN